METSIYTRFVADHLVFDSEKCQAKFVLPGIEGIDLFDMQYYPSIFGNVCFEHFIEL